MNETIPQLTVIDIEQETAGICSYKNIPLSFFNDHVVRVGVMTEPFYWHYHPNIDETFMAIEGNLLIDLEDRTVELKPGQLFTIPAMVKHRTRPAGAKSVNLTFELASMETVKCDIN
ncbi:cupin domain-containing protein [Pedobacter miscanthi]|uniref:Cupin domain-containing protein n=1 Tax=Pedobacter miscanthi TaxID=2259170 RepID=A0A366LCD7_9SPHI|nr:cupin domain-containing protein [Pedobacter miscanthi]RBQ11516.1 cupin domain-containing protein [Pedobacter miscanthi]